MTGNDVVDMLLAAAESNWQRKGFAEKLFTSREQSYINGSANPFAMTWKLWSMKESAYKLFCRLYGGRFFAPQKFTCTLLNAGKGLVTFQNFSCHTITRTTKNYVYSIAHWNDSANAGFINSFFYLPQTAYEGQQEYIHKRIIEYYQSVYGNNNTNISISKDKNGIPFLKQGDKLPVPLSITHHGRFAAFTIN